MLNLNKLKGLIFDILFPPICFSCQTALNRAEKEKRICNGCFSKITIHATLFCGICRARLPENKKICHKNSPYILGAATDYDETAKKLIHQFKYRHWTGLENIFGNILKIYLNNLRPEKTLKQFLNNCFVVPIPLYKEKERERGFNQAEILGKTISKILSLPLENKALVRIRETKPQAELKDWDKRKENMDKSFKAQNPERIKNANIILVDDVYTSGATISEAVKTLRNAGAKKIIALVIAKTR